MCVLAFLHCVCLQRLQISTRPYSIDLRHQRLYRQVIERREKQSTMLTTSNDWEPCQQLSHFICPILGLPHQLEADVWGKRRRIATISILSQSASVT